MGQAAWPPICLQRLAGKPLILTGPAVAKIGRSPHTFRSQLQQVMKVKTNQKTLIPQTQASLVKSEQQPNPGAESGSGGPKEFSLRRVPGRRLATRRGEKSAPEAVPGVIQARARQLTSQVRTAMVVVQIEWASRLQFSTTQCPVGQFWLHSGTALRRGGFPGCDLAWHMSTTSGGRCQQSSSL